MEVLKLNDLSEMSMLFGGDYNPEQWPEDSWQDDIDKLKGPILIRLRLMFFHGHYLNLEKVSTILLS